MKIKYTLYVFFGMKKIQNPLLETEKTRKTQQKKRKFDAHQNQYINSVHKMCFKISKNNVQKL